MSRKTPPLPPDLRPSSVSQVNKFLRQHGVEGVELRRHSYYFDFFGPATYSWLTSAVMTDRLNSMTLGEWLEKYRALAKLNRGNALAKTVTAAVEGKRKRAPRRSREVSQATGRGYEDFVSPTELARMKLLFQRRHVLGHKQGFVDQAYIDKSGDTTYAVGQRLVVRNVDVDELAALVEKVGAGLRLILQQPHPSASLA